MRVAQTAQRFFRFVHFLIGRRGVYDSGIQHLAGAIHHGELAAVPVAGVETERHTVFHRRLHKQGAQVERKGMDRLFVCRIGQFAAQLALQGGEQQPFPAILTGGAQHGAERIFGMQDSAVQLDQRLAVVHGQGHLELTLLFPAVDCKDTVALQPADRLGKFVIHRIDGILRVGSGGLYHTGLADQAAQAAADIRIVRDILRNDVRGA